VEGPDQRPSVEVFALEERRPEPRASALDAVRARTSARDNRRLGGLDRNAVKTGEDAPQFPRHPDEAARSADVCAEGVDPALELLEELAREPGVAVEHVAIAELVGREAAGLLHDLLGALDHPREQLRGDPFRARHDLELGAEHLHRAQLLPREYVRADDPQGIALEGADIRKRGAGAPTRVLDDRLPRKQAPVSLGALDHRERHAVLVRPGRVVRLELDPDLGHARLHEPLDAHDRRGADRAEHPAPRGQSPNGLMGREPVETTTLFVSR